MYWVLDNLTCEYLFTTENIDETLVRMATKRMPSFLIFGRLQLRHVELKIPYQLRFSSSSVKKFSLK